MITVPTRDIGEVRERRCCGEVVWGLEDGIEEWVIGDLGVGG